MITIYDKDNANNNDNDSDRECSMNNDNGHATLAGNGTTLTWILDKDSDIATYSDSCYFNNALSSIGFGLPEVLTKAPKLGGIINLPAMMIILILLLLLLLLLMRNLQHLEHLEHLEHMM